MKGSWDLWSITWTGECRAAGAFLLFTEPAQKRKSVILWSLSSNRPDTQSSDICVLSFAPGSPRVSTVCSAALTSPLTPGHLEIAKSPRLKGMVGVGNTKTIMLCWKRHHWNKTVLGGKGRILVPSFWICGCLFFSYLTAPLRGEESQPALRSPRMRFLCCDGAAPHVVAVN